MKWINPGILSLFPITSNGSQVKNPKAETTETGCAIDTGHPNYNSLYPVSSSEFWCSYDYYLTSGGPYMGERRSFFQLYSDSTTNFLDIYIDTKNTGVFITIKDTKNNTILYTSEKTIDTSINTAKHNIEMHYKAGDNGRVDIWIDHTLFCSFRSPSAFPTTPSYVGIAVMRNNKFSCYNMYISSIIIQDTRRIGYEKFKMLTVDPATEQNMPQGSTTNYTISGLSDATEFSDITSFGAIMQTTSKDANITTGTFSLNGSEIGTIDVSDSSGKAYEIAHSETNPATTKPWTRDDIEGKTLSFTVNGAT